MNQGSGSGGSQLGARLVFADTGRPLHHVFVRVHARHLLFLDSVLAEGWTDEEGRLEIDLGEHGAAASHFHLQLEVRDGPESEETPRDRRYTWPVVDVTPSEDAGPCELGDVHVPFWPYRTDWSLPRAIGPDGKHAESNCAGVEKQLLEQKARFAPVIGLHMATAVAVPGHPSHETIQKAYPENLTLRTDREQPGRTRTDAWLADRLLNGMSPVLFAQDTANPGRLRWRIAWGDVPPDGTYDLTDVDAAFELRDGLPLPVEIALRIRSPGEAGWDVAADPRVFHPADGPDWEAAKRVLRVQWLLAGELDAHMTLSHMRVEQYGVALRRNLRRSPLLGLLGPHLREICGTNVAADLVAWGQLSATVKGSTFLTPAIRERMQRTAGREDWLSWTPREPLSDRHVFAHASKLYWEALDEHVSRFLEAHRDAIAATWAEVRRFSDDLVRHSVAHVPLAPEPGLSWADHNELPDDEAPRQTVEGVARALRPVTTSGTPDDADLRRLAQLCRYVIHHATWWHSWVHDRQYDDGGEIRYASLGLRNGSLGPEDDDRVGPAPIGATLGLGTIAVGCAVRHGYLLANEDGDVPQTLRDALESRQSRFAELGVDLSQVRCRINI